MKRYLSVFCCCMIACSTLADDKIPFPIDWNAAGKSAIDLSRYLDAPAGRAGFVKVEGEHFVDGAGQRLRLWGVNLTGPSCFPTHEQAEQLAESFARLGINCVRFHGLDSKWGRSSLDRSTGDTSRLDEANLERFDYLFDQLRRRGIYGNVNLNVFRVYGSDDGLPSPDDLGLAKWATHFYPRLIELQEKYAVDLLTHQNPYTGHTYADDPAVLVVEIVNENSLIEGWLNSKLIGKDDGSGDTWSPLPTAYAEELNRQLNRWLTQNRTPEMIAGLRREAGLGPDEPFTLLRPDQFRDVSAERFAADYEFIVATERSFLARMKSLIKDRIGLQSMLVGDADHNDSINGYPHILNNRMFDYLDGHGYWQHPSIGSVTRTKNDAMVNDPTDSTVVQFARTPMVGVPFVISETNHPYPHIYASEGIPILAAYAMLQDWDGVIFHEWGEGTYTNANAIAKTGWFHLSTNPMKMAQLMVAGLMWHRHDLRAAEQTVIREITSEQIRDRSRLEPWKHRPFFDDAFPRTLPLVHRTQWQVTEQADTPDYPAINDLPELVSDTKEIRWHGAETQRGRVVIDSPRVQAMIGFHKDAQQSEYRGATNISVSLSNEFAAIMLLSLDDNPITESKRLLLFLGDRAANQDLAWQDDLQTVAAWGDRPVAIRPVQGRVSLWGLPGDTPPRVRLLDSLGRPTGGQWPVNRIDNGWQLRVGNPAALMAIIER